MRRRQGLTPLSGVLLGAALLASVLQSVTAKGGGRIRFSSGRSRSRTSSRTSAPSRGTTLSSCRSCYYSNGNYYHRTYYIYYYGVPHRCFACQQYPGDTNDATMNVSAVTGTAVVLLDPQLWETTASAVSTPGTASFTNFTAQFVADVSEFLSGSVVIPAGSLMVSSVDNATSSLPLMIDIANHTNLQPPIVLRLHWTLLLLGLGQPQPVIDAINAICADSSRPSHPSAGWVPTTAVDFGSYMLYACLQEMQASTIEVSSTLGDRVPVDSGIASIFAFFCVTIAIGYIFWRLRVAYQQGDCSRRGKILRRVPSSLDPPPRRVAAPASTPAPVQVSAVPTVLAVAAEHTPRPTSHVDAPPSSRADVASTSFEVEAENSCTHNDAEHTGAQTLDGNAIPKEISCSLARPASAVTLTAVEDDADPDDAQPSIERLASNTTDNPLSTNDV